MNEKIASLRRAVEYGLANRKRNIIADLDVLAALFANWDMWRPLTPEEAEKAYAEAEAVPLSQERIDEMVRIATDPATHLPNSELVQLAAEITRLKAKVAELEIISDREAILKRTEP